MPVHYQNCSLCEANCGLEIAYEGKEILSIRGDKQDPFSKGYLCPKGTALQDLHADPDRLRGPMRRNGDHWEAISWDEAFEFAGQRIAAIQKKHGYDAIAFYYGNPTAHHYDVLLHLYMFADSLKSRNIYSSASVDGLPRQLTSLMLYGNQGLVPIPDIDRTDFMLIMGANPVVSNGSAMTAPNMKKRLKDIRKRGGRVVVIDPRKTRTAELADQHHFIRPGTDALLLLAMIHVLFAEDLVSLGHLKRFVDGLAILQDMSLPYSPERVAEKVGIKAEDIRELAVDFAKARAAVCYGRMGTSVQLFGAMSTWLIDVFNILTGNLDSPGGVMFNKPAVDLASLAKLLRRTGHFNKWQTRVQGLPEFTGESPTAAFAEEMETPGKGQIKALITHAGNPVLSLCNGVRLEKAFENLDFMVCMDIYLNETTRHADLILPPTGPFEHDHYSVLFQALAVRHVAHYNEALFPKPSGSLHGWEIVVRLEEAIRKHRGLLSGALGKVKRKVSEFFTPPKVLDLLLRFGPWKLRLQQLKDAPHGLDLGPLEPRLLNCLSTPRKRLHIIPPLFRKDFERLQQTYFQGTESRDSLVLIGRRDLLSLNSWMHNFKRLNRGDPRSFVMVHPQDAASLGLEEGEVRLTTQVGEIIAYLQISDEVMPGVVSLAHGWGHHREKTKMGIANGNPGVSFNDISDETLFDQLSGTSVLNGIPVELHPA